jgi:hypothetical protein
MAKDYYLESAQLQHFAKEVLDRLVWHEGRWWFVGSVWQSEISRQGTRKEYGPEGIVIPAVISWGIFSQGTPFNRLTDLVLSEKLTAAREKRGTSPLTLQLVYPVNRLMLARLAKTGVPPIGKQALIERLMRVAVPWNGRYFIASFWHDAALIRLMQTKELIAPFTDEAPPELKSVIRRKTQELAMSTSQTVRLMVLAPGAVKRRKGARFPITDSELVTREELLAALETIKKKSESFSTEGFKPFYLFTYLLSDNPARHRLLAEIMHWQGVLSRPLGKVTDLRGMWLQIIHRARNLGVPSPPPANEAYQYWPSAQEELRVRLDRMSEVIPVAALRNRTANARPRSR